MCATSGTEHAWMGGGREGGDEGRVNGMWLLMRLTACQDLARKGETRRQARPPDHQFFARSARTLQRHAQCRNYYLPAVIRPAHFAALSIAPLDTYYYCACASASAAALLPAAASSAILSKLRRITTLT
ncbi:hypothetical protein P280DRAFT_225690 [Massarina eburnea CBS 473.64]|uniref:Uncharacterized protein n=1 Tax=Massarina eburnea CBS 473.64 TaxID=1395130 RepID=A0A6A6S8U7_9PLEO|nr:hypothetical protein P280DRAFT_225690 [Massarina eburnea CBS 473.64]